VKTRWFKDFGPFYYPVSGQGVVLTGLCLAFCIQVFVAVDRNSHSASDTLYGIFPFVIPSLIVLYLVAMRTSDKTKQ
jgi:hypothetical protein